MYIPVIEIEGKDYAYHSKNKADVSWSRINHSKRLKEDQVEEFEVEAIITFEGYLILEIFESEEEEDSEKMAILKLSDIKLSRKSNQLIITDKGKGLFGSLLSTNNVLGSLVFDSL